MAELSAAPAGTVRRRGARSVPPETERAPLGVTSGTGLGLAVLWLSLLVLVPLAAVVSRAVGAGPGDFWAAVSTTEAVAAIRLTVLAAAGVSLVNAVMGTLVAWVLVREEFPGKRLVEVLIDIPFALPTIVAGLVLTTLYGPNSPIGVTWYATRPGVLVALLFVTLPFVVRTVEPVLLSLETEAEQAAASLGAGPVRTFVRIVLPAITPAIASGAALAFGRAMGEYGSVVLISGQLPRTEVASQYIYQQIESGYLPDAAATATVLLVISVLVLAALNGLRSWAASRG
ncbi:sulfate ABC transporter permease subunit CysT [Jatrophihabitans sp.]|uniref:sulfate ABC transporter permease subunit CysT n=1 Tax=Jatrophihabitans sp. TaxID=1932789 RepID=UPI002C759E2D|nr:sulfate ABC transporter permease subunit CysT [Jatrophihabitans sp.]